MAERKNLDSVVDVIDAIYVRLERLESLLARDSRAARGRVPMGQHTAKLWLLEEIYDLLALLRKRAYECCKC